MMQIKFYYLLLPAVLFTYSCQTTSTKDSKEKWKNEIVKTEQNFSGMAQREGIPKAFLHYAADDAVLMRNNQLIIGKESLNESYSNQQYENVKLTWKPDFVDVSASGDLGYTYGKYTYTVSDSLGIASTSEGIFHTIWKRQKDGSWKFVWD